MKPIQAALEASDGKIFSFKRNTIEGWWEIEVGLPIKWVFYENSSISCEVIGESDNGKLIKVYPKNHNIVIDDLISYVDVVIKTNEKIAEKEKQFSDKMEEMKNMLTKEAEAFYAELDELKENSFKKNNTEFDKNLNLKDSNINEVEDKPEPKKEIKKSKIVKRGRPKKVKDVTEKTDK